LKVNSPSSGTATSSSSTTSSSSAASSSSSLDKEAAKKLWKESEILTGIDTEQILESINKR